MYIHTNTCVCVCVCVCVYGGQPLDTVALDRLQGLGLGFRVQGLGFRVQGLGNLLTLLPLIAFRVQVQGLGFRVQGLGCGQPLDTVDLDRRRHRWHGNHRSVQVVGFRVQAVGCRVQGLGFRFQVLGFRHDNLLAYKGTKYRYYIKVPYKGTI